MPRNSRCWHIFVVMSVVLTVWGYVGMLCSGVVIDSGFFALEC